MLAGETIVAGIRRRNRGNFVPIQSQTLKNHVFIRVFAPFIRRLVPCGADKTAPARAMETPVHLSNCSRNMPPGNNDHQSMGQLWQFVLWKAQRPRHAPFKFVYPPAPQFR